MKYVVLGASSFYGSNFCQLLEERGEEVVRLSRPEFDIDHPVTFRTWNYDIEGKIVVNFIAQSLVAESWEHPGDWLQTNVVNSMKLIEHCQKPKMFLHISTPEVYGSNTAWRKERRDYLPTTPYAVSRASFDMLLYAYWKTFDFPMMITRTSNIYGWGQQDYRLIPKAFRLISNGEKFPLHGNGKSVRSFIHVRDACEALYLITLKGSLGETYHISTQEVHSINQVLDGVCKLLRVEKQIEKTPDRHGKDHAYLLDSAKLRALGWNDKISLTEGLQDYASRFLDHKRSRGFPEHPPEALQITG